MADDPHRKAAPVGYLGITRRPSRREWRRALVLFAAGAVGLTLLLLFVHPQPSLLAVGTSAPPISLRDAAGGSVRVPGAAGEQPYVLEFFEAGCSHCQQVASRLCAEKVPVFAVDAAKDSAQTITSYRNQYAPHCTYPMLVDPGLSAATAYAVNVVPTVYLVKGGRVVFSGAGLDGINALDAAVQKAVGA